MFLEVELLCQEAVPFIIVQSIMEIYNNFQKIFMLKVLHIYTFSPLSSSWTDHVLRTKHSPLSLANLKFNLQEPHLNEFLMIYFNYCEFALNSVINLSCKR